MKIVVLDGYTLNPGDLSWDALKQLGECTFHERSRPEEVVPRIQDATIALTNKVPITRDMLAQLPQLKHIAVTATGYNIVDSAAARERGITVSNVPAYGTSSVAQMTFALLLELTNRAGHHAATVKDGRWARSQDFCYADFPLVELCGKTLGIIGYGRIGQEVASIGRSFGMNIATILRPGKTQETGVKYLSLEDLLKQSDVISLHCPLTPETKGLINRERLNLMKRSVFLVNTSRGPLIVEEDLAEALHQERIAGAALDVLTVEPPPADHVLYKAPNCIITPHIAWATKEARARLMSILIENLRAWIAGTPRNIVN